MIKAMKKLQIEGTYLNLRKTTYDKLRANIILNGEKIKPFPIKSAVRKGYPSPVLLNIVLKFLAITIRCERN
jgi:hypothetical protein